MLKNFVLYIQPDIKPIWNTCMSKNRIIELLARKQAGEATPAELEELNKLTAQYQDSVYYEEFLKQLWLNSQQELEIPDAGKRKRFRDLRMGRRGTDAEQQDERSDGIHGTSLAEYPVIAASAHVAVFNPASRR